MSADGTWNITVDTPMGTQSSTLELASDGASLTGTQSGNGESGPIYEGSVDGDEVTWKVDITRPMALTVTFKGKVDGDRISGKASAGIFPPAPFDGTRG
jgi:hypothetical protein